MGELSLEKRMPVHTVGTVGVEEIIKSKLPPGGWGIVKHTANEAAEPAGKLVEVHSGDDAEDVARARAEAMSEEASATPPGQGVIFEAHPVIRVDHAAKLLLSAAYEIEQPATAD